MWGLEAQLKELREENRLLRLIHPRRNFDMRVAQEQVTLFMQRIGDLVNYVPKIIDQTEAERRAKFILEECQEYAEANAAGNLVEVADAIADLAYVVIGAAISHGIDLQPIFDEVHRSNMTKATRHELVEKNINDERSQEKRCAKGDAYEPPRIAELLLIQSTGLEDGYGHGV